MNLSIVRLHPRAAFPILAYDESAAFDLSAVCMTADSPRSFTYTIAPNSVKLVGTGLAMQPPSGHLILVCSRSGLAARGIFVANAPGVVDPSYTGEIKVALFNGSLEPFYVKHGDRIAQALIVPFASPTLAVVEKLPASLRGERGFGSSGD